MSIRCIPSSPRRRHSRRSVALGLAVAPGLALISLACESPLEAPPVEESSPPPATLPVAAQNLPVPPESQGCGDAVTHSTGALYQICWPAEWNGAFIVYAHGYVSEFEQLAIPAEAEPLATFVGSQGFAFASTSFRINGLAIPEGVLDMVDLAGLVRAEAVALFGEIGPVPVLVTGASEGGAIATLAAEGFPFVFQGALSTCGPTGDFQGQLDYLGDFNVLFNYFFPDVFANPDGGFLVTPAGVDPRVIEQFGVYAAQVQAAVAADPGAAAELLKVAGVPVDPTDPAGALNAIGGILWYNVFATNDGIQKLGGRPFDNRWRWYRGSSNDLRLNLRVERYRADAVARARVARHYETTGRLDIPYVSLHTTGDEIVEFRQQPRYRLKALLAGSWAEHSAFPVVRYGHCNFEEGELAAGLGLLILKVGASSAALLADAMPTATARSTFREALAAAEGGVTAATPR